MLIIIKMFCCGKKRLNARRELMEQPYDLYLLSRKYRFSIEELRSHEERFLRMADGDSFALDAFCESMGLLGLKSTKTIAEGIFSLMDTRDTGRVSFDQFLAYMDVLMHGTPEEKARQSFKLIARNGKDSINYDDFALWVVNTWKTINVITGKEVNGSHEEIKTHFDMLDLNGDGVVDFEEYKESLRTNTLLFQWFDTVDKGIAGNLQKEEEDNVIQKLNNLQKKVDTCLLMLASQSSEEEEEPWIGPSLKHTRPEGSIAGDLESVRSLGSILIEDNDEEEVKNQISISQETEFNGNKNEAILHMLKELTEQINEIKSSYGDFIKEPSQRRKTYLAPKPPILKKNSVIQWGDEDWNFILNMMLGIQKSVRAASDEDVSNFPTREEFEQVEHYNLLPNGIYKTQNRPCKFTDYAPMIFKRMRNQYRITENSYIKSLGIEKIMHSLYQGKFSSLVGLLSSGQSGSFFYYSDDGRFVIKTLTRKEYLFLKSLLPHYFSYLRDNPDSLITKFYGFHKIRASKGKKLVKEYFAVMSNVFDQGYEIHMKYDLKGSTYKRNTSHSEDFSVARKDLDFLRACIKIDLGPERATRLMEIIGRDAEFLQSMKIMDYSFLIGIHYLKGRAVQTEVRPFAQQDGGGLLSSTGDCLYLCGIIDILTFYSGKKKFEHFIKDKFQGDGISCIPPVDYAKRFIKFLNFAIQ